MQYLLLKKFESDKKIEMNCNTGLTLNNNAETIVSSKYYQNCQLKKSKRCRSAFTTEQINYLERQFKNFPYIGSANRKEVANILNISERAVKIWFQNRRMKEKREINNNKELTVEEIHRNNISNEQLNNRNIYLHNECGINDNLQSMKYQNEHLKESNIETEKLNCTLNKKSNITDQIKVKSVSHINISDNKCNNRTIDMIKDTNVKSVQIKKIKNDTRKIQTTTQRNKHIEKLFDVNREYINDVNIPIPLLSKNGDVPQDLSLNNIHADEKEYQQFYPVHSSTDQKFMPIYTQGYYVHQHEGTAPTINPGNVIWKPVSVMPILPGLGPASTMTIGHNNSITLNNQDSSKGTCNCHGPPHLFNARMQCVARTQPQYILAIPFNSSSHKV